MSLELIGSLIASFALGLVSSFVIWWLSTHFWIPRIRFSEELAEYELPNGERFFQIAFKNIGRREIIDIEVQVRVGIFGFLGTNEWAYHTVTSNSSRIPLLSKGKRRRVRVYDSREDVEFIDRPSKSLRDEIEKCRSLRDVLQLGTDGTVRVHVLGFDEFGGARKHYCSKPYRLQDIRKGTFKDLDVVQNERFQRKP